MITVSLAAELDTPEDLARTGQVAPRNQKSRRKRKKRKKESRREKKHQQKIKKRKQKESAGGHHLPHQPSRDRRLCLSGPTLDLALHCTAALAATPQPKGRGEKARKCDINLSGLH